MYLLFQNKLGHFYSPEQVVIRQNQGLIGMALHSGIGGGNHFVASFVGKRMRDAECKMQDVGNRCP